MATIIVGSYMVRYPLGGNLSWALQYLTGLKQLGHDVYMVEKYVHEDSCYDPEKKIMTNDSRYGVRTIHELLNRYGLGENWCYVGFDGTYFGLPKNKIDELFRRADLYIENGSHGVWKDELTASPAKTAYIDVDPAFTQINFNNKQQKGIELPQFDFFFTNGWNIGKSGNVIPTCGIQWRYIFNPVNTSLFPLTTPPDAAPYSTIMNWKSYVETARYKGVDYGHKDLEFDKFMQLPAKVNARIEVAIANAPMHKKKELMDNGWVINNAQEVTSTYDAFINYLSNCRGEFSVVKNMYAATCCGWFSDKSAAFLASGRPVVLQETGFSQYLPVGEGLFAVKDAEEAKHAIDMIEDNYARHSSRALEIANEYLDTRKVLGNFLAEVGL